LFVPKETKWDWPRETELVDLAGVCALAQASHKSRPVAVIANENVLFMCEFGLAFMTTLPGRSRMNTAHGKKSTVRL